MLEFADPNPFKEFHIGHLRNIILGESYARLLESQGAMVWSVNYQGDVRMHVAKALFGMKNHESRIKELENQSIQQKVRFLGECYALGAKAYEENEDLRKEIQTINKKIFAKDSSVLPLWQTGRQWSLEYFETIYKQVHTTYKRYYFESETVERGMEIVNSHIDDGVFERDEGAIIYRGKNEGLQNT